MAISRLRGALGACLATPLLISAGTANAALVGRLPATPGGTDYQAYYDTILNITWLADANLAASNTFGLPYDTDLGDHPNDSYGSSYTERILPDGNMNWGAALHWIDAMNASNGGAGYLGFNDWRLPTMIDISNDGCNFAYSGTDCGYNVLTGNASTTVYSEMASMFYDTLGNLAYYDTSGNVNQPGWGLSNTGPFANLEPTSVYWSGLEDASNTKFAWLFLFDFGLQQPALKHNLTYACAVRSGDVVPVPAAVWLFGSGLTGLLGVGLRRRPR